MCIQIITQLVLQITLVIHSRIFQINYTYYQIHSTLSIFWLNLSIFIVNLWYIGLLSFV